MSGWVGGRSGGMICTTSGLCFGVSGIGLIGAWFWGMRMGSGSWVAGGVMGVGAKELVGAYGCGLGRLANRFSSC